MLGYFLTAIAIVAVIGALIFCIFMSVEKEDWRFIVGAVVIIVLIFTFVIKEASEDKAQGPCLQKETNYAYNSATKTMAPYTRCVERGEWIK